ncbi:hypothetical protein C8Q74DRAFT_1363062 [Fomes fomentarius]|nr:hypothetical protein C8Q74DRAFT_1363062 [Fomes fomentarius]
MPQEPGCPPFTSPLAYSFYACSPLISLSSIPHKIMHFSNVLLLPLALIGAVAAGPIVERREPGHLEARQGFVLDNGRQAQALNRKFQTLNENSPCTSGENACVNGGFAQCANGRFVVFPCNTGLRCFALPLVLSPGTSLVCDTEADAAARIAATGAGGLFGREYHEDKRYFDEE